MEHILPRTGRTLVKQWGHTGSREIFGRGSPQRRQSEGHRTEKRLSAAWRIQLGSAPTSSTLTCPISDEVFCNTIGGPDTAALAWLARIRSSLLLKTASSLTPRTQNRRGPSFLEHQRSHNTSSIAVMAPLGNVAVGRRCRMLSRHDPGRVRQPFAHLGKNQPVVPAEAFSAAHRFQQKQREDEALRQCTTTRLEPYFATTIATTVRGNHRRIRGIVHLAPLNDGQRRGRLQIDPILHQEG